MYVFRIFYCIYLAWIKIFYYFCSMEHKLTSVLIAN